MPGNKLPAHMQRVAVEAQQLDERLERLTAFVDTPTALNLPPQDRVLLGQQLIAMVKYGDILTARLLRANGPAWQDTKAE